MMQFQSSSGTFLPRGYVPSEIDILCGRGKANMRHSGNQKFIATIRSNLNAYSEASTQVEKSAVVTNVVSYLLGTGMRFLKFDSSRNQYVELSSDPAHEKVGNAIRDLLKKQDKTKPAGVRNSLTQASSSQHASLSDQVLTMGVNFLPNSLLFPASRSIDSSRDDSHKQSLQAYLKLDDEDQNQSSSATLENVVTERRRQNGQPSGRGLGTGLSPLTHPMLSRQYVEVGEVLGKIPLGFQQSQPLERNGAGFYSEENEGLFTGTATLSSFSSTDTAENVAGKTTRSSRQLDEKEHCPLPSSVLAAETLVGKSRSDSQSSGPQMLKSAFSLSTDTTAGGAFVMHGEETGVFPLDLSPYHSHDLDRTGGQGNANEERLSPEVVGNISSTAAAEGHSPLPLDSATRFECQDIKMLSDALADQDSAS